MQTDCDRIIAATKYEEIIAVLPLLGLGAVADRLAYLRELSGDDDPNEPSMALASLQRHSDPEIGVSPDGLLQAEWPVRDGGVVAMKFLPAGLIQFAAISNGTNGSQRFRIHGTLPKDQALDAARAFRHENCQPWDGGPVWVLGRRTDPARN